MPNSDTIPLEGWYRSERRSCCANFVRNVVKKPLILILNPSKIKNQSLFICKQLPFLHFFLLPSSFLPSSFFLLHFFILHSSFFILHSSFPSLFVYCKTHIINFRENIVVSEIFATFMPSFSN
jgi:hypothetical protein